jgi:hypothetical protein
MTMGDGAPGAPEPRYSWTREASPVVVTVAFNSPEGATESGEIDALDTAGGTLCFAGVGVLVGVGGTGVGVAVAAGRGVGVGVKGMVVAVGAGG